MIHSITLPGGHRVHTETEGQGEPVVFVHADFVDGRLWDQVRSLLNPRWLTAAYDKLGYGRSERAAGPIVRRRELAAVIEALDLGPVHLVGCSNGGTQALDYALERPGNVRTLTLVNSAPSGWQPQGVPPAPLMAMIEALQAGDQGAASELQLQIWFDGPHRQIDDLSPRLREARGAAATMNRIFVENGTFFVADASPPEPLNPPALERLNEVAVRTLVVDGRLDWSENRRASSLLATIPGSRRIEIDAAHVPPLEDPEGFVALWEAFVLGKD